MMRIKAIITGATGMVGKGVLQECLDNEKVESVLVVGRQSVEIEHPKLKEIVHKDFFDLKSIKEELKGYNTCYFCLGISSFRMNESDYTKITYDLTLNFAKSLLEVNKEMIFCYVSGTGTDSSEVGKTMWARVKGKTENDLLALGFKDAYMFRPGFIYPQRGIKSKTPLYNTLMPIGKVMYPFLKRFAPQFVTTTTEVGLAMINVAGQGYSKKYLENQDINDIAKL